MNLQVQALRGIYVRKQIHRTRYYAEVDDGDYHSSYLLLLLLVILPSASASNPKP